MLLGVGHWSHTQIAFVSRCVTVSQVVAMNIAAYDRKGYLAADLPPEAANIFCLYKGFKDTFQFLSYPQFSCILFSWDLIHTCVYKNTCRKNLERVFNLCLFCKAFIWHFSFRYKRSIISEV